MAVGEEVPYTHAVTVLSLPKSQNLLISDPAADSLACWPAKPPGYTDKPLFKLRNLTNEYVVLTLFQVKREVVSDDREQELERELRFIMTGQEQAEAIHERRVASASQTNKKRAMTIKRRRNKGSLSLNKSRRQVHK